MDFLRAHEVVLLIILSVLFVAIRLPGTALPLHQDEYKWPMIVNPANHSETSIPHPPLSQFIYRTAGFIVGFNVNFRFVPLFFGTLNLLLLYYFVRMIYGRRTAVFAVGIWIVSYFSVLASLMVDTDGEIMPFFFLLALIGYYKAMRTTGNTRLRWLGLLVVAAALGFLVKVSFMLAIGAIVADFLWSKRHLMSRADLLRYLGYGVGGLVGLVALLLITRLIFPFFDLKQSVTYWEHFAAGNRNWFQTAIQCFKAFLYSSPLLVIVPLWGIGIRQAYSKSRPFIFFLIFAFIFYIVLFDFSLGALDRYLQLVILPLSVLSAVTLAAVFDSPNRRFREFIILGSICAIALVLLQSLPHSVPSLHPKAAWIGRIVSLKWNFLYPFSGGSGPLGFYISFLFMGATWIVSVVVCGIALIRPTFRQLGLAFLLPIALVYNIVFTEEYLSGYWNGSAPRLLTHAVQFIAADPDIKMVTSYNDNGGDEIRAIGKYRKRLYTDPQFDINEKIKTLNEYKEHYFVLDVPRVDPASVYQRYFDSCAVVYRETDRAMSATIYDCRNVPDIHL